MTAPARLLLMAKAPIAGRAKTRLGAEVGMDAAADLAAAALLDTVAACSEAFPGHCHLALAGDLDGASGAADIRAAICDWQVFEQHGDSFAQRLAHAHRTVAESGPGAVVQIGMDTPQVTPALLRAAMVELDRADAVLGPAVDGGWWLLALRDGRRAHVLSDVPMSVPHTYDDTVRALESTGATIAVIEELRDVDTRDDAGAVAAGAPDTLFARSWLRREQATLAASSGSTS